MTDGERTLLKGCFNGDKAAWDAFVAQYSSLVYHAIKKTFSLYHSMPSQDQAEDLFQEFFLRIVQDDFRKLRQFRGDRGCSLASWLRVVAARLTIDFLRKQKTTVNATDTDTIKSNQPDPPGSLIDDEEERLLSQAVQALPPRDRLFVDLHFRQALPPEEVGAILKVSVNAVYTQKSRILDKLRETLKKNGLL